MKITWERVALAVFVALSGLLGTSTITPPIGTVPAPTPCAACPVCPE